MCCVYKETNETEDSKSRKRNTGHRDLVMIRMPITPISPPGLLIAYIAYIA